MFEGHCSVAKMHKPYKTAMCIEMKCIRSHYRTRISLCDCTGVNRVQTFSVHDSGPGEGHMSDRRQTQEWKHTYASFRGTELLELQT